MGPDSKIEGKIKVGGKKSKKSEKDELADELKMLQEELGEGAEDMKIEPGTKRRKSKAVEDEEESAKAEKASPKTSKKTIKADEKSPKEKSPKEKSPKENSSKEKSPKEKFSKDKTPTKSPKKRRN